MHTTSTAVPHTRLLLLSSHYLVLSRNPFGTRVNDRDTKKTASAIVPTALGTKSVHQYEHDQSPCCVRVVHPLILQLGHPPQPPHSGLLGLVDAVCNRPIFRGFSRVITRPVGPVRRLFKISRVESGSGQEVFEISRGGPEGFQISRVGSGRATLTRPDPREVAQPVKSLAIFLRVHFPACEVPRRL